MLPISGIEPFTTIDYPGELACVLFTQGCLWKCRYCHNTALQPFLKHENDSWKDAISFLESRKTLLGAVVLSGGEPTAHYQIESAVKAIKKMGFKVGCHTAGIFPERFKNLLDDVNWVGFDFKAPLDSRYDEVTQVKNSFHSVEKSLDYLLRSGVPFQLRCTYHPRLLSLQDIEEMKKFLKSKSVLEPLVIQPFRTQGCSDVWLLEESSKTL